MELLLMILKFGHCSNLDSFMACKNPKPAENVCVIGLKKRTFINECVRFVNGITFKDV